MNIYRISQTKVRGWDTYSSAVVIAESDIMAARIHPASEIPDRWGKEEGFDFWNDPDENNFGWCRRPEDVTVEFVGWTYDSTPSGVVLASFHAG